MSADLQPLNVAEFQGGLNLRATQFTLADDESPDMLNIDIDPRGGIATRKGWSRWNQLDAYDPVGWNPRHGYTHSLSSGEFVIYLANDNKVLWAGADGAFSELIAPAPFLCGVYQADFAAWGDSLYIAAGTNQTVKVDALGTGVAVDDAYPTFNDDYTTPVHGKMPVCSLIESHLNYMFCAVTVEGTVQPNRLRWSHPDSPDDWHTDDVLDILTGGGRITALKSFRDHLIVFKESSVWALYGYDSSSWQLVRLSDRAGTIGPPAVAQSEGAIFFYSPTVRSSIFAYDGEATESISFKIQPVMDAIVDSEDVWLGWVGRSLWMSLPWMSRDEVRTS